MKPSRSSISIARSSSSSSAFDSCFCWRGSPGMARPAPRGEFTGAVDGVVADPGQNIPEIGRGSRPLSLAISIRRR